MDPTPPEIAIQPQFLSPRDKSPTDGQWDRSLLQLSWLFRDPDSSVVSHTVYIRSKLTGRLVVDPVFLGAETQVYLFYICLILSFISKNHLLLCVSSYTYSAHCLFLSVYWVISTFPGLCLSISGSADCYFKQSCPANDMKGFNLRSTTAVMVIINWSHGYY